jgi:hypothetical protein
VSRARICKRFWAQELIPGLLKCLQIRVLIVEGIKDEALRFLAVVLLGSISAILITFLSGPECQISISGSAGLIRGARNI